MVGVDTVEFLDGYVDGLVEYGIALRHDLAAAVRRHRPEVLVSINYRDFWGPGSPINHGRPPRRRPRPARRRRDAGEPLALHRRAGEPWSGTRLVAFNGSPAPTHVVDVTGFLDRGIASLREHRLYLDGLGDGDTDPDAFLRGTAEQTGAQAGVEHAVAFEVVPL